MHRPPLALVRFALVAVVLIAPGARAAETLRWSPKPGETLKYAFTQVFDIKKSQPGGQDYAGKTEVAVDLTWKVAAVAPDGTVEIAQTVDHVSTRSTGPGAVLAYDSNDRKAAEASPLRDVARSYEAVLGKPYTIKLSPLGEVVDVTLPEGVAEALAGSPFAAMADAGTFFSATGVKNLLAQVLPTLPKGPVERGSAWESDLALAGGPFVLAFKTRYTLARLSPLATIDAQVATTMTPSPGAKITIKINKQSGTARFTFDAAAGRLDSATITQSADVTINDGNAEFSQSTEATLTFRLVK